MDNIGKVVQVIGPVIDIRFDNADNLPAIYIMLIEINTWRQKTVVAEVAATYWR